MSKSATELRAETERTCKTTAQLRQRCDALSDKMLAIVAQARQDGRANTADEDEQCLALMTEAERIGNTPLDGPSRDTPLSYDAPQRVAEFVDQNGRKLHALRPTEKFADLPLPDNRAFQPLSIGRAIVGLATGKWEGARAEKLAMSEGSNAGGGFLVNDVFSKTLIDAARAQARLVQAGATTVPWDHGDRLTMARVETDPTFSVVAEHGTIPGSDIAFGKIGFTAHKIGTMITLSRELAEDAPNASQIVEQTLTRAFAAELDRLGLVGSGSSEPNGLLYYTDVNATDSIGEIAWEDVHNAAVAIRTRNFEPTGYICSPTIGGDLDLTQASTAGTWLVFCFNLHFLKKRP